MAGESTRRRPTDCRPATRNEDERDRNCPRIARLAEPVADFPWQRAGPAGALQHRHGARDRHQDRRLGTPLAQIRGRWAAPDVVTVRGSSARPACRHGDTRSLRVDRLAGHGRAVRLALRDAAIGFGGLAVDLIGAVLITSLLRHRLGLRTWRTVHWLGYLAWPVAFIHAITAARYDLHIWWVVLAEWGSLAAVATALMVRQFHRGRPAPAARPGPKPSRSDRAAQFTARHCDQRPQRRTGARADC